MSEQCEQEIAERKKKNIHTLFIIGLLCVVTALLGWINILQLKMDIDQQQKHVQELQALQK